ncbi:MAG: outer membrane protein assembly factor BamD [Planctomycetota bacterium]
MHTAMVCAALVAMTGAEPKEWDYGPGGWRDARPQQPETPPDAGVGNVRDGAARLTRTNDAALTIEPPGPINIDPLFDPIVDDLGRNPKRAFNKTVDWLLANPTDPMRDQGLYLAATALFEFGNRAKSFFYCDELLDTYPESPLYDDALRLQYTIADEFLKGYKERIAKLPIADGQDKAIEMLFRIQERAPGSPLAEQSVLRAADHFYGKRDFDFAAIYYQAYIEAYPRSPQASEAKLRLAFSNLFQYRGPEFDSGPVIEARNDLAELIGTEPDMARERELQKVVTEIDIELVRKRLTSGDYYRRTGEKRAAAMMYQSVLDDYPLAPQAEIARRKLEALGPVDLSFPEPGAEIGQ